MIHTLPRSERVKIAWYAAHFARKEVRENRCAPGARYQLMQQLYKAKVKKTERELLESLEDAIGVL